MHATIQRQKKKINDIVQLITNKQTENACKTRGKNANTKTK